MELTYDLVIYLLGLATTAGMILARIATLEKKVEKHNNLVERMYQVEAKTKSHSRRLENLEERS